MTTSGQPVARELSTEEPAALLARNAVGRLAFCWENRVDIEPIHYVYDAPWIFGRTRVGAKLLALFTENDPMPDRTVVFGIHANEISARAMSTS